jgi:hypothetical protein
MSSLAFRNAHTPSKLRAFIEFLQTVNQQESTITGRKRLTQ